MLPNSLYKMLPYIYIVVGVICAILVNSGLVYFSSALLVSTGLLVLWLRHAGGAAYGPDESGIDLHVNVRKERRRVSHKHEFPLINHNGEIIAFDRRLGSV